MTTQSQQASTHQPTSQQQMTQPHTGRPGATQDKSDEGFCGGACGAGAGAAVIWRPLGQGGGGQSR